MLQMQTGFAWLAFNVVPEEESRDLGWVEIPGADDDEQQSPSVISLLC